MNPALAYITDIAAALVLIALGTLAPGGRAWGLYAAGMLLLGLTWGVPTLVALTPRYRLWRRRRAAAKMNRTAAPKP
jgi:hypothetical protein